MAVRYDEVGYWSEIKLDIIRDYAKTYSTILSAQVEKNRLSHVYIDAFAGAGQHISRATGDYILGSPLNALNVDPPFHEYYFIDINKSKVRALEDESKKRSNVYVYEGDCNLILLNKVFPKVLYENRRRGLCLLDPYGLHVDWQVLERAGQMKSVEIF